MNKKKVTNGEVPMKLIIFIAMWAIVMIVVWLLGDYVEKSIHLQKVLDEEKLQREHLQKALNDRIAE